MGAARALGQSGPADEKAKAVPALIDALQDASPGVRSVAIAALGRIGDSLAAEPLIDMLGDSEVQVRMDAAKALEDIGEAAVDPLILALNESDNNAKEAAAMALGRIGEPRSIEPLIWAFRNADGKVRHAAVKALAAMNGSLAVPALISILEDQESKADLRADAAFALGEMDDSGARDPLIRAMADDGDSRVRMSAALALKSIGKTNVPEYSI
jgi:HEAT repeat protein